MALPPQFQGYAETTLQGGKTRRFLLALDLSVIIPTEPAVVNYLNLDPDKSTDPDLQIGLIVRGFGAAGSKIEIRLRPMPNRVITGLDVRVFVLNDSARRVYPLPAMPQPPVPFAIFRYTGTSTQAMPSSIGVVLGQEVAGPDETLTLQLDTTPAPAPLQVAVGRLEGPVLLTPAVATAFGAGNYAETPPFDIVTVDEAQAPSMTYADLAITDPAATGFPPTVSLPTAEPLNVQIRSPHAAARIVAAPAATLAGTGAGQVDKGRHRYKFTCVLANGNETGASDASDPVEVVDAAVDGHVVVTKVALGLPPPPTDAALQVVGRRIYRTAASADGGSGEYLLVGDIADNVTTTFVDDVSDDALGDPIPDRLTVWYNCLLVLDGDATLRLRDAGVETRYEARLFGVPVCVAVTYTTRPDPGLPRVHWRAGGRLSEAQLTLPTLDAGVYKWGLAVIRDLVPMLGVDWASRGSTRLRVVVGSPGLGDLDEPGIGDLALLVASRPQSWRDAPQTVCVEMVDVERSAGVLDRARLRLGVRGLRFARIALGEPGKHSELDDGVKLDVLLGADPARVERREFSTRPDRSLRVLRLNDTYAGSVRDHSHLSLHAGVLPDRIRLDFRSTDSKSEDLRYFGMQLKGQIRRVKVLAMTNPSHDGPSWQADGRRVWVTVADTGESVNILQTIRGIVLETPAGIAAEVSVRDPAGLDTADDPIRHIKAALGVPPYARLIVPFTGSSRTTFLTDEDGFHPSAGVSGRIGVGWELDQFLATRSTPQVKGRQAPASGGIAPVIRGATVRVLGFRWAEVTPYGDGATGVGIEFDPARVNTAFRAQLRELDSRFYPDERDWLKARVSFVPASVSSRFNADAGTYRIDLGQASGEGILWMERSRIRAGGPADGKPAGIEFVKLPFVSLPRALRFTLIDEKTTPEVLSPDRVGGPEERIPPDMNPLDAGWVPGGFKLELCDTAILHDVEVVHWDHDHATDLRRTAWGATQVSWFSWTQSDPTDPSKDPRLDPVLIWQPHEKAGDFEHGKAAFGFDISKSLRLTLDLDNSNQFKTTSMDSEVFYWRDLAGGWVLAEEVQMKDYANTATIADKFGMTPAGHPDDGPGLWFLHALDVDNSLLTFFFGYKDVYFGNTGGNLGSRPRIFK